MDSIRKQAQSAGILYFLIGITAPIGLELVPGRILVRGDATATAAHLRASEALVRVGIASELFHQAVCIFLVLALYRLFQGVSRRHAVELVVLGALVSVPIVFVNVLNEIAALVLVGGAPFLAPFDKGQLDALAFLFLRLHQQGITVASIFWGLWLFPFGILVVRSGFIPRVLGLLLFIAGAGYLVAAFGLLVLPALSHAVGPVAGLLELGEIPIILWLVIWGATGPKADEPLPA